MNSCARVSIAVSVVLTFAGGVIAEPQKWEKGKGWGWVWGEDDEVGSLNEMTSTSVVKALSLAKQGKVRDLGITYDRTSYKWPGHSPAEIMTFRSPGGVRSQKDLPFTLSENPNARPFALCNYKLQRAHVRALGVLFYRESNIRNITPIYFFPPIGPTSYPMVFEEPSPLSGPSVPGGL